MIDLRNDNPKNSKKDNISSDGLNSSISNPNLSLSPYLNYDPVYFPPSQSEFIFPDETMKQRGRFELAFSQIGGSFVIGCGIGGIRGLYRGLKVTALTGETGKLRRTHLLNHIVKHGTSLGNGFAVVSLMYSGFGVLFSSIRETEDMVNTIGAATATGMLFKSTAGLKKCLVGGGIGFTISAIACLWNNRNAFPNIQHRGLNPV